MYRSITINGPAAPGRSFGLAMGAITMRTIGVMALCMMAVAIFISTMLVPVVYVLLETMR